MATHSNILAWRIPWTVKSTGSQSRENALFQGFENRLFTPTGKGFLTGKLRDTATARCHAKLRKKRGRNLEIVKRAA